MNTFKKLRQEKHLTQMELAKILNIDQTTVSKWELGKAFPDTALLIQLSSFFDVSTDYLLGLSTLFYPDRINSTSSQEEKILQNFRKLPADLQHRASAYMEKLVELTVEEKNTTFSPAGRQERKAVNKN